MDERRHYPRLKINLDVKFALLIPHETFTALSLAGRTTDLAIGGMRLRTEDLEREQYLSILRGQSSIKVSLNHKSFITPIMLRGQVVWCDYHDATANEKKHCFLGVSFYNFTEGALEEYSNVLEQLEKEQQT